MDVRNSTSLNSFKNKITRSVIRPIKYSDLYFFGDRYLAILHARLRLGASQLNSHLFKIGVKDSPKCSCGAKNEDAWHYFFVCPNYTIFRHKLQSTINQFASFTLHTALYGSPTCSYIENTHIFSAVHEYISDTERFKTGIG